MTVEYRGLRGARARQEQRDRLDRHHASRSLESKEAFIAKLKAAHAEAMRELQRDVPWEAVFTRPHWPNVRSVRGPESA